MKILFKFATRSRPQKFFSCLENIINAVDDKYNYLILVSYDKDDTAMEYESIKERIRIVSNSLHNPDAVLMCIGESKNKIDAINRDLAKAGHWDILINTSDDMVFTMQGFDNFIRFDMITHFPDLDGFLHYNDGNQKDRVCTMSIMGKKYFDRFNYIYHSDYKSVWCDSEATDVAKILGKHRYMGDDRVLFKHLHPAWGLAEYDTQYKRTESSEVWEHDENVYQRRKANNFYLPKKLQILIPYSAEHKLLAKQVEQEFRDQIVNTGNNAVCGVISMLDEYHNRGKIRNKMLELANADYIAFFDADDKPSSDYINRILKALESKPDCCSMTGVITWDGENPEVFEHSIKYAAYKTNDTGPVKYERYPNHLNVIRSEIAKQFKFPEIDFGEDTEWATKILRSGLLKKEAQIEGVIYHYQFKRKI